MISRILTIVLLSAAIAAADPLPLVQVSANGKHFVRGTPPTRFVVWGVNYDHDAAGRLLDEYWIDEWSTVVEDFHEIKALGANCVRVHLQLGMLMESQDTANAKALQQLGKLVQLAEDVGLYLDLTGLACYHKHNIPGWYDGLNEVDRWSVQAKFWASVAEVCKSSPAVFCYDLMNEPILPGDEPASDWLAGEFDGKHFVQRLSLALNGRTREAVAEAWVNTMVDAIRQHDTQHLVTVGEIPWIFVFGGGKPLFHLDATGQRLDFVAVHFYPRKDEGEKALRALKEYDLGKPLLVEEMFPLACSEQELVDFVDQSKEIADGWISFYWGKTASELREGKPTIGEAITASWLQRFQGMANP